MTDTWSTHDIEFRDDVVVKSFRSRERAQPLREWQALHLLTRYAPGLAPEPIRADLEGEPPVIVMSRLEGVPLRGRELDRKRLRALAEAVGTMHDAIPPEVVLALPACTWYPPVVEGKARSWSTGGRELGPDPTVAQAFEAGRRWLADRDPAPEPGPGIRPVFGLSDGNLANYLWDGTRVRLVDFEISGRSDRAFELAEIVEHISMWPGGTEDDTTFFLSCFEPTDPEIERLRNFRTLLAFIWLLMLLPDSPGHDRNPPGTLERQAARLLAHLDRVG
ncbi:aminoglycoside phosphotransferase family protein [Embleya scabrispora]|uniref:aminoglycoside phosphotransferase family protein n=1 Tax=Embleya scabrispora TaxID=159449 RepID=UPI00037E274C|nr:aminoglycoside phosphotransferase family protein [Embleya scabrispora]MYS87520.1 phosphotransferase [Streptomyces sp. SID5474]